MKVIIDKFENGYAVVELPNKKFVDVPKELFPGAKESDIIEIKILTDETAKRKTDIMSRFKKLQDNKEDV